MTRSLSAAVLALALLGAGPASKPATLPVEQTADPSPEVMRAELAGAEKSLAHAKAQVTAAFDASDAGKALAADVESRKKVLAQAKASGVRKDRLDATAAFNAARKALEDARASAASQDSSMTAATAKVAAAQAALDKAAKKAADAADAERMKDPMNQAAAQGRILIGMTREQVREALRVADMTLHGVESTYDNEVKVETWGVNSDRPDQIIFRNDLVVTIHNRR
jgi:multidrug efflux pump subunit AcrA (membrane-fusion protein)